MSACPLGEFTQTHRRFSHGGLFRHVVDDPPVRRNRFRGVASRCPGASRIRQHLSLQEAHPGPLCPILIGLGSLAGLALVFIGGAQEAERLCAKGGARARGPVLQQLDGLRSLPLSQSHLRQEQSPLGRRVGARVILDDPRQLARREREIVVVERVARPLELPSSDRFAAPGRRSRPNDEDSGHDEEHHDPIRGLSVSPRPSEQALEERLDLRRGSRLRH